MKVIDGLTNPTDIAERFAEVFEAACRPNNPIKNAASQYDFENGLLNYESSSNLTPFNVFEVAKCVDKLKHGKAPGLDAIKHACQLNNDNRMTIYYMFYSYAIKARSLAMLKLVNTLSNLKHSEGC